MEEQLQSLLERIRREGVERADADAAEIVDAAREQARRVLADAEGQADALRREAEADAQATRARGETALEQAGRDFLLGLQKSIEAVLRETLCDTVGAQLSPEIIADMLVRLAEAYAARDMNESRVEVLLSAEDRDRVAAIVLEKYRELVRQGLNLRPDERIDKGFKVSFVDYQLYHDFTLPALAEALAPVLKAPLCDIIDRAAGEQG